MKMEKGTKKGEKGKEEHKDSGRRIPKLRQLLYIGVHYTTPDALRLGLCPIGEPSLEVETNILSPPGFIVPPICNSRAPPCLLSFLLRPSSFILPHRLPGPIDFALQCSQSFTAEPQASVAQPRPEVIYTTTYTVG